MDHLNPEKLHIRFLDGSTSDGPRIPRCYTLTHSDTTGELFLTIGPTYDHEQISGWYTRFMRDEVLAVWEMDEEETTLHVHVHVSGGLTLGSAKWRDKIFRRHMPMVLEAFRYGDRDLVKKYPELEQAPIVIHFHAPTPKYDLIETWDTLGDYR
ncbi:MAG: staygreen family protein [Candidatus Hodarchaeota archaeon]